VAETSFHTIALTDLMMRKWTKLASDASMTWLAWLSLACLLKLTFTVVTT